MPYDYDVPIFNEYDKSPSEPKDDFGDEAPIPQLWCKKCSTGTREYFSEYCNNTSLHGLKYVGGEKRSRFEKVMWTCLFLCSVSMCSYMIYQIYYKWLNTPVIVSFSQMPTTVGTVPFPAVTICPQNKAKQSVHNFTRLFMMSRLGEIRPEEQRILDRLKVVCNYLKLAEVYEDTDSEMAFDDDDYYESGEMVIIDEHRERLSEHQPHEFEDESIIDFLAEAAPSLSDIFDTCIWNGRETDCEKLFYPTLNEDGICYTFNMISDDDLFRERMRRYDLFNESAPNRTNYFIETGYGRAPVIGSYPYRTIGAGIRAGLEIRLRLDEFDFDYICKTSIQGFKIILHDPVTIPRGRTKYIRVPIDQEITIAVQPNMITTSENLAKYSHLKRYCYFQSERKLNFFKNYTQQNCELECLGHYIQLECGCVPFYMPRMNTTRICGHLSQHCVDYVERSFFHNALKLEKNERAPPCRCYPACFSIDYAAETTQATYEWWKFQGTMDTIDMLERRYRHEYIRESEERRIQQAFPLYNPQRAQQEEEQEEANNSEEVDDDNNDTVANEEKEEMDKDEDDTKQSKRLKGEDDELHVMHYTSLKIFFKDYQFTSTERSELYGFSDFVANIGGLLGLFTGFSFLSLMEILYYLTIRAWINKHLFGKFLMETPADPDEYIRNKRKADAD